MREPDFWYRSPGWASMVLKPLGALYGLATARRVSRQPTFQTRIPVICIGNLNAGGTGKTPTVIALVEHLIERGKKPVIVSRGYGGRLQGPVEIDPAGHTAADVGDEPLLLSAFATTIIARDRAAGAQMAEQTEPDVIVLDDGHQNPSLYKDFTILTVDAVRGFGNGAVIPAGPLREPIEAGLRRADVVLIIGAAAAQDRFSDRYPDLSAPRLRGELRPLQTGMAWQDLPVVAFAGIGEPEKFFATLRSVGADLRGTEALDDHQPIAPSLFERLLREARENGAQLVTTEKDAARLTTGQLKNVLTLPVRLRLDDWSRLDEAFERLGL